MEATWQKPDKPNGVITSYTIIVISDSGTTFRNIDLCCGQKRSDWKDTTPKDDTGTGDGDEVNM